MRLLLLIGVLSVFFLGCVQPTNSLPVSNSKVCIDSDCFNVQIADSPSERQRGLMEIPSMPEGEGMLFIFESQARHSFWMKDTKIALDIIWINAQKEIVEIATLQPCAVDACPSYTPSANALYVLEINAGLAEKLNIATGNRVTIELEEVVTAADWTQ